MLELPSVFHRILQGENLTLAAFLYDSPHNRNDPVNGSKLWAQFCKQREYYLYSEESELISVSAPQIAQITGSVDSFIDLGPGSKISVQKKTLPLLKSFASVKVYSPVDLAISYIEDSAQTVRNLDKRIKILHLVSNFFYDLQLSGKGNVFLFFSGSTIGNLDVLSDDHNCKLSQFMKVIHTGLPDEGHFLITQDSTQNVHKLIAAYRSSLAPTFVLNIFHRIQRDMNLTNFDPTAFCHQAEWNPKIYAVETSGISTKRQIICIDEKEYTIEKDFPVPIARSYKLPPDIFLQKTRKAGFESVQSFNTPGSGIYLHLLRKSAESSLAKEGERAA